MAVRGYTGLGGSSGAVSPYIGPVATAAMMANQVNTTASSTMMTRKAHYARTAMSSVQLAYANWFVNILTTTTLGTELGIGNDITVTCWVEYPVGTYKQVTWNGGSPSASIADLTTKLTDFVTVSIPKDALFFTWTYVTPTSGNNFPYTIRVQNGDPLYYNAPGEKEACVYGTSGVPTTPGAISDNGLGKRGYWPCVILGPTTSHTFFLLGDSRTCGDKDTADISYDLGIMARSIGPKYAYINCAVGGDKIAGFNFSNTLRMALSQYCTVIMECLGVNDILQASAPQSAAIAAYKKELAAKFNNRKFSRVTMEPNSFSTDNWATVVNQSFAAATHTAIVGTNAFVRSPGDGVAFTDINTIIESSLDSGFYIANGTPNYYSADGLHLAKQGNIIIQTSGVMNPDVLAALPPISVSYPSLTLTPLGSPSPLYAAAKFGNGLSQGGGYVWGVTPSCWPFTIEGWAKTSTITTGAAPFGCAPVAVVLQAATGNAGLQTPDSSIVYSSVPIADGTLHHLAITVDFGGVCNLWVDGALACTHTFFPWTASSWSHVGRPVAIRFNGILGPGGTGQWSTGGVVDEVAIWNTVKYTGSFTPPIAAYVGNEANLIALWHLDGDMTAIRGPAGM